MADKVISSDAQLKEKVEESNKPQCQAFIPGIDRLSDYTDVLISLLMVALMFLMGFGFMYFFGGK